MFEFDMIQVTDLEPCPHCGKRRVKHIIKEGARYHVHWWDTNGTHCSEKDCEDNHGYGKCVPQPEESSDKVLDEWQRIAEELWQLLDNIDTASDIAKSDDKLYRGLVAQVHKKRFDYADSDGYKLTWKLRTKEREQG